MKKKFITKLILSGAALAASAATLVSTTYAWYVQNTQVTATGVSGSVKDNEASSIYISKDYSRDNDASNDSWDHSVEFVAGDHINPVSAANATGQVTYDTNALTVSSRGNKVYNGGLAPITLNAASNGTFVYADNTATIGTETAEVYKAKSRVIEFDLYVQANVDTTIRPYLIIANNTTSTKAKPQTAYKQIDGTSGALVSKGGQFWIDAVQALRMQVDVTTPTSTTAWSTTPISSDIYEVFSIAHAGYNAGTASYDDYVLNPLTGFTGTVITEAGLAAESTQTIGTESVKLRGANKYYYDVTGRMPAAKFTEKATPVQNSTSTGPATKINQTNLTAATVYKFTFRIWLEGTDPACFDACIGQTFSIGINFDVEAPEQQQNP